MTRSIVYTLRRILILMVLSGFSLIAGALLIIGGNHEKAPSVSAPIKELSIQSGNKIYTVDLVVSYDTNIFMFMLYDAPYTYKNRKLIDSIEIISPAIGINAAAGDLLNAATANFANA